MDFLARQNIYRFNKLLETEGDPIRRATIKQLLRQEKSKLIVGKAKPSRTGE